MFLFSGRFFERVDSLFLDCVEITNTKRCLTFVSLDFLADENPPAKVFTLYVLIASKIVHFWVQSRWSLCILRIDSRQRFDEASCRHDFSFRRLGRLFISFDLYD